VVVTAAWIRRHPELLASHTIRDLMAGNLCRCTGYDGIIDGVEASLSEIEPRVAHGGAPNEEERSDP
jgi:aerobic-type carbon monoxide dehydrogenase small subunit (CoxS/CutS family)